MDLFEKLYEEDENVKVRFVGFATDSSRFDFGIVYTNLFLGKPLVICMQTNRSALLDAKDLEDIEYLQSIYKINDAQQASELASFFTQTLSTTPYEPQY